MTPEMVELGSLVKVLNGYAFKSGEYVDDGIRIMRITNVQKSRIVDDDPKFISAHRGEEFSRFMLENGDILISLTGNVGRVGVIDSCMLPAALNQRVGALKVASENIDPRYLFHILNSDSFEQDSIKNSKGVAQLNLSSKWIEKYKIPLPALPEQKRIAAILDAADALRAKRRESIEQLDKLAQSVFIDMFGDPVTNPKGWESLNFDDCIEDLTRHAHKVPKTEYMPTGEWQIIDQSQNEIAGYADSEMEFKSPLPVVVFGDHTKCVKLVRDPFLLGADGAKVLATKPLLDPVFLANVLPMMEIPDLGYSRHMKEVKRLTYICPPVDLQKKFSRFIESLTEQKTKTIGHLNVLNDLFVSLQSQAFSGNL